MEEQPDSPFETGQWTSVSPRVFLSMWVQNILMEHYWGSIEPPVTTFLPSSILRLVKDESFIVKVLPASQETTDENIYPGFRPYV